MSVWEIILGAILILLAIGLIVLILMQDSRAGGLSGAIGGGSGDTFFGKHKGRSLEARLGKMTRILCGVFIVLALGTTLLLGFFVK